MFFVKKNLFLLKLAFIFLLSMNINGQSINDTYKELWKVVDLENQKEEIKKTYINIYLQKARAEKNKKEEFRILEKKIFMVNHKEAISLIDDMLTIAYELKNDSLIETGISAKTSFYYANRDFKDALNYAVQAENFNLKTKDLKQLNVTRLYIGNIYYHTKYYSKALEYFNLSKEYFNRNKYKKTHIYITTLYSLNKVYWKLNETDSLLATIKESEALIPLLQPSEQINEKAYIAYVTGGYFFLKKDYKQAETYFLKALPILIENEDFTNEHVIYLYLGKVAWELNQKEKAMTYFSKIDKLFKDNNFLNYELRETYEYLIKYYKEKEDPRKQLEATESLIALNKLFEKEQQYLTETLHYELETKKLETSKIYLQKQLASNKSKNIIWLILISTLSISFLGFAVWQNNQKKQWRKKFDSLINDFTEIKEIDILKEEQEKEKPNEEELLAKETTEDEIDTELSLTEKRLLIALEKFEQEKAFLKPLKLDDFALQLNTNRNTLSKLLNTHKEGFSNYIGNLRIKQMLLDLQKQPSLRRFSMQGLAETYGFTNAKTFGIQFKMVTGLTPAYFIKQLEIDDAKSSEII